MLQKKYSEFSELKLELKAINLDKRNYEKVLIDENFKPDTVYLWKDEEVVRDYITEEFPDIKLKMYSRNIPDYNVVKNNKSRYSSHYKKEYNLINDILSDLENNEVELD